MSSSFVHVSFGVVSVVPGWTSSPVPLWLRLSDPLRWGSPSRPLADDRQVPLPTTGGNVEDDKTPEMVACCVNEPARHHRHSSLEAERCCCCCCCCRMAAGGIYKNNFRFPPPINLLAPVGYLTLRDSFFSLSSQSIHNG